MILWFTRMNHGRRSACAFRCCANNGKREGQTSFRSLADYLAPVESGLGRIPGAFAVTAGAGAEELAVSPGGPRRLQRHHDEGAGRPAGGGVRGIAARAPRRDWGYGRDEHLTKDDLIHEKYRGIRPAAGYPWRPNNTEKAALWRLLDAEAKAGIRLTESYAMTPAASVSGLYSRTRRRRISRWTW